jgi:hypothetical protein
VRFLAPLFLAGAALVALPIVLHLLRRDVAAEVPFTAVRLLRGTPLDRSRRRRLRDLLLLAARVVALLLLAGSFARPFRPQAGATMPLTIVAVDRSFSMAAPATLDRARALARQAIDAGAMGRQVALVAFDDGADVLAPPGPAADARAALTSLSPGFGSTRYGPLFDRAAELAGDDPAARLVVISDLQRGGFDDAEAALPRTIHLQVRDVAGSRSNLAIDAFDIRDGRARVSVRNYGAGRAQTTVRLEQPSRPALTRTIDIDGDSSRVVSLDGVGSGPAKASIDDSSGYAADDARFAVPATAAPPRVIVITGEPGARSGFYFIRALEAPGESGAEFDVREMTGAQFAQLPAAEAANASAIVVLSTLGLPRQTAGSFQALLAAGGGVFAAAGPDVEASLLSDLLGLNPALRADESTRPGTLNVSDVRHPVFRPMDTVSANLSRIAFDREWQIARSSSWKTVAAFSTGTPALVEQAVGNGRVLLFASDVDRRWNDFPLHAAFVPFVQETVHYVAPRGDATGPILVGDVPEGIPAAPGIVTIRGQRRAVNVDTRESAVDRMTPEAFAQAVPRTAAPRPGGADRRARDRETSQGLWRYGLGLMLLTLAVEACVGAR